MSTSKQFISLDADQLNDVVDFQKIRTWMPVVNSESVEKREPKSKPTKKCFINKPRKTRKAKQLTIFDCISTVLNSDIKQQPSSLGNLRHQRSMNDQKKKLSQEPRLTPETKPSKTFISLEEVKQSMEHYGEVIINDDPHADSDSIPRPPSQSASEILPYVLSKTLVSKLAPSPDVIVNESPDVCPANFTGKIFDNDYDPRVVQKSLDKTGGKFIIVQNKGKYYAVPMNSSKRSSFQNAQRWTMKQKTSVQLQTNTKFIKKSLKNLKLDLGFPVGIQLGSESIKIKSTIDLDRVNRSLTCCQVAVGQSLMKPESRWSTRTIDEIINTSKFSKTNGSLVSFELDGVKIELKYGLPIVDGNLRSFDPSVPDIYQSLKSTVKKNKYIVFSSKNRTLLIWKKLLWFVFDPCGRSDDCSTGDLAALISLKSLENVIHLIINLSDLRNNPPYTLTPVKILKVRNINATKSIKFTKQELFPEYTVLNTHHAILRSPYHLRHQKFNETRNKQSMAMCVAALVYSKLKPAAIWNENSLTKVGMIGNQLFKQWSCNDLKPQTLKDLKKIFHFAQFHVTLNLTPFIKDTPVADKGKSHLIYEIFNSAINDHHQLLVQVGLMFFAVWTKNDIFYLFDPYPRDDKGDVCLEKYGQCCVHMFSFLEQLSHLFRRNITQLRPDAKIYLHAIDVQLTDLQENEDKIATQSLSGSVDWNISSTTVDEVDHEDKILVLDSPTTSVSSLSGLCESKNHYDPMKLIKTDSSEKLDDDLSALSLNFSNFRLRAGTVTSPTPSAEYLCGEMIDQIASDVITEIDQTIDFQSKTQEANTKTPKEIIAERILLKSDLAHLENKRKLLVKTPISTITQQKPFESDDKLFHVTNFSELPDGAAVLFGSQSLLDLSTDLTTENRLAVVAIAAVVASYRYNIGTWNKETVNFVLEVAIRLASVIKDTCAAFFSIPNHKLPDFELGNKHYTARLEMIKITNLIQLPSVLEKLFNKLQRVIILSPTSSISLFKYKMFYYMYEAYPCNIVGFRVEFGRACVLRFTTLDAMLHRLKANRRELESQNEFVISQLLLRETDKNSVSYPKLSDEKSKLLLKKIEKERLLKIEEKKRGLRQLDDAIAAEKDRIKNFCQERKQQRRQSILYQKEDDSVESDRFCDRFDRMFEPKGSILKSTQDPPTLRNSITFQESPKSRRSSKKSINYTSLPPPQIHPLNPKPTCGYVQRNQDLLYKIQGSAALESRCSFDTNNIRACHFANVYAALLANHYPMSEWNFRKIDLCLENGIKMFDSLADTKITSKRTIENILVANIYYKVMVFRENLHHMSHYRLLSTALERIFMNSKSVILQYSNCSFCLFKDDFYHIFDPYDSLETCEEIADSTPDNTKTLDHLTPDQSTASLVLCRTLAEVLRYLEPRVIKAKLNKEYSLYKIDILDQRRAPKTSTLSYLLYKSDDKTDEQWICNIKVENKLKPEEIQFVEKIKIPPWSRLISVNAVKQPRWTPAAKSNKYDIEIAKELHSLWANISPLAPIFKQSLRGKQYLAINALACATANLYHLDYWSSELIDSIIVNGDRYFEESLKQIKTKDYDFQLSDLNTEFEYCGIGMSLEFTPIVYGQLYAPNLRNFNLSRALTYFFREHNFGILVLTGRALAIGKNPHYFMFDCQSHGKPLFKEGQGAAYLLYCCSLRRLLESILITLNVKQYCVTFCLHSVEVEFDREGIEFKRVSSLKPEAMPPLPYLEPIKEDEVNLVQSPRTSSQFQMEEDGDQ